MEYPQCSRCKNKDEICDICDMISYDFQTVRSLQSEINQLRKQLNTTVNTTTDDNNARENSLNLFNNSADNFSVEVGTLSTNNSDYIGTASGVIFTKIFLNQLKIPSLNALDKLNPNISSFDIQNIPIISLPTKEITIYLLQVYIEYVEIFYPILDLSYVYNAIDNLYANVKLVNSNDKFMIFMILAITSEFSKNDPIYVLMNDMNTSKEYFYFAFKYIDESISKVDIDSIRNIILLILWCLCFKSQDENENLWLLTRHVASLCIQLGFHRNNTNWKLSNLELEKRNRIWWSSFVLERSIAVQTGRTLSIRNHAIDAQMPSFNSQFDKINSNLDCPFYSETFFQPMILLSKLRTIAGDILESVYIARGNGKTLAVEVVHKSANRLREELDLWLESVMELYINQNNWVYKNLKLYYTIYSISLSRPSPTFPDISILSAKICLSDSKAFIDIVLEQIESNKIFEYWLISSNILTISVTFLFSAWFLNYGFNIVQEYVFKIKKIMDYLMEDSKFDSPSIKVFNTAAYFTLQHLDKADNNQSKIIPEYYDNFITSIALDSDEERKNFLLSYLLMLSGNGPFSMIYKND